GKRCRGHNPLDPRCPRHPEVELLLDPAGRLHLLAPPTPSAQAAAERSAAAGSPTQTPADPNTALLQALETRQWAVEHLDLLALAHRNLRFDRAAAPALHLFTTTPHTATHLATHLGPAIHLRLHLLQHVTLGNQSTWLATPLT
ncbi:MAG: hypothetical protein AAF823_02800, partial [Planctomycetota bacterium]